MYDPNNSTLRITAPSLPRPNCRHSLQGGQNVDMQTYKFPVGTTVHVSRRSLAGQAATGAFKVVARYTSESAGPLYRVRSVTGLQERMVPEYELATSDHQVTVEAVFPEKRSLPLR